MKRFPKIITATCAAIALTSSLALAAETPAPAAGPGPRGAHIMAGHGMGMGMGMAGPLAQLTPEKQEAAQKLMAANYAAQFPLHQSLYAKHAELEALTAGGEGESGKAKAVIRDIADLNAKMLQENSKFRTRLFKETGLRVPVMGHGGMGGMMGGRGGMGCGMMGGKGGMMGGMGGMGGMMGGMAPVPAPEAAAIPAPPVAADHTSHN